MIKTPAMLSSKTFAFASGGGGMEKKGCLSMIQLSCSIYIIQHNSSLHSNRMLLFFFPPIESTTSCPGLLLLLLLALK